MRKSRTLQAFGQLLLAGSCLAALAALVPSLDAEAEPPGASPFTNYWLDAEGRYSWMHGPRQPWAGTSTIPFGTTSTLETVQPDRESGGRILFGLRFGADYDFSLAYTGLRSNTVRNALTDFGAARPVLGAFRPGFFNSNSGYIYTASASVKINRQMHLGDFEAGYRVGLGSRSELRLFGGVRFVSWSQVTTTNFDGTWSTDSCPGIEAICHQGVSERHRASFLGAGPRLGANGEFSVAPLGDGEIMLLGRLAGSLAWGNARTRVASNYSANFGTTAQRSQFDDWSQSRTRLVYNLEAQLAVGYRGDFGGARGTLRLGYRFDGWWNMADTVGRDRSVFPPGQAAPEGGQFGARRGTLYTHGPLVGLVLEF